MVRDNPQKALSLQYKSAHHKNINWDNPQTLDEKIMWLEAMTDTSIWSQLTDKYEVRKFIEKKGYKEILVDCYGVWNNIGEINFETLPNKFVIKCTHDSGSTHIIKDKSKANIVDICKDLQAKLHPIGYTTCEPHYLSIQPRIIAEELLEERELKDLSTSMIDYKVWCFNGVPNVIFLCYDRHKDTNGHSVASYDIYDVKTWEVKREYLEKDFRPNSHTKFPRPPKLEDMIECATNISRGFPVVRVDFYCINNKIYFGEMTFTSAGANCYYFSNLGQRVMGQAIDLSNIKIKKI
ncbi:ATP-grasp fold amidoligase family protein [Prevotella pallens]|jgi:hypothetical protein|uniref:ATP-grasp fold amidoligase family protein n=1 Tax=Prevotella pallens TaxID=60133 RepID=UPI0028E6E4AA|nr:ATP-grasp fold amidoligase family protein [Prevotella pallens]